MPFEPWPSRRCCARPLPYVPFTFFTASINSSAGCRPMSAGGASDISRWQARSAQPPDQMGDNSGAPEGRRRMPSTHLSLHYHLTFSTKNRVPLIAPDWRPRLHAYLGGCVRTLGGVPETVGGVEDHVHLLIGLKATHRL